ncbi:MAG TPA: phage holin family protein [Terracidiphilus sp.]|nr:phage holin family protein [Terracidiphilus sp.]
MNTEARHLNNGMDGGRTVGSILSDTKEELREFLETRITMLRTELGEKMAMLKAAAPLAVVGILFLLTAYMLFSVGLVGVIVALMPENPYRWCIGFFAIAVLWGIVGGICAYMAMREFQMKELMPKRTMQVLKEDKLWLQSEVRSRV